MSGDLELFLELIQDLFPGLEIESNNECVLGDAITESLANKGFKPGKAFINKVQELHSNLKTRYGVVLVGRPGVGKTACYKNFLRKRWEI